MKIGITCYPTYGVRARWRPSSGSAWPRAGTRFTSSPTPSPFRLSGFHERVYFHEVELEHYPLFETSHYTLALAAAIHDTAVRVGLDIVHVHYAIPHATSAWIAREMQTRLRRSSPRCTAPT